MSESVTEQASSVEAEWNARYAEKERIWSGKPNALLVREAAGLEPGRALDLGCGEGADVIWLAHRGWHVLGVDISDVALGRAAEHALSEGVEGRADWQRHTLGETFPDGEFDLITASFLHNRGAFPRERVLREAAAAVAPGGTLLIISHHGHPAWAGPEHQHADVKLPTPQETLAALELDGGAWEAVTCEVFDSPVTRPDGEPDTRPDNVVRVRRIPSTHVSDPREHSEP